MTRRTGVDVRHFSCMSNLMNSVEDLVKDSVKKHFTTEEIIEAKKLVFGQCQDKLGAYQERKGDGRGSRHLNDLFDALRTLDMGGVKLLALCSHVDLGKLPRLAPAEMDMASILDRVIRLERLTGGMADLQATVSSVQGRLDAWLSTQGSYAARVKHPRDSNKPETNRHISSGQHSAPPAQTDTQAGRQTGRQAGAESVLRVKLPKTPEKAGKSNREQSGSVSQTDDGFQLPRHQRRKEARLVRGTAKHLDSNVKGGGPVRKSIFVSRLDKSVTEDDLKMYMKKKDIEIDDVKVMSHDEARFRSFKFSIANVSMDRVLDASIWPENCFVKRFYDRKVSGGRGVKLN